MLARCTKLMDADAAEQPLTAEARAGLEADITSMAASGLRTLCLAQRRLPGARADYGPGYFDQPPDEQLTLCCIIGIKARRSHAQAHLASLAPPTTGSMMVTDEADATKK